MSAVRHPNGLKWNPLKSPRMYLGLRKEAESTALSQLEIYDFPWVDIAGLFVVSHRGMTF